MRRWSSSRKRRVGNDDNAELLNIIGEYEGMIAILIDDEIDTAGSLVSAVSALTKGGRPRFIPAVRIPFSPAPRSSA
jgi:ribose-phosphate pyrophosphokinase